MDKLDKERKARKEEEKKDKRVEDKAENKEIEDIGKEKEVKEEREKKEKEDEEHWAIAAAYWTKRDKLFREWASDVMPFFFSPDYDKSEARRSHRDAFLREVIVSVLLASDEIRKPSDDEIGLYWTVEELYVVCRNIWIGMLSKAFEGRNQDGMMYPNPNYIKHMFECILHRHFDYSSEFHFAFGTGYTMSPEDRLVPFEQSHVQKMLNELIKIGDVATLPTKISARFTINVEYLGSHADEINARWAELNPTALEIAKREKRNLTSEELEQTLFGRDRKDLSKEIIFTAQTASTTVGRPIVTLAELLIHGDYVYNCAIGLSTEAPRETSEYKDKEYIRGVRTIIEPAPYGYKIVPEKIRLEKKHLFHGTYVNGTKYMVDKFRDFFKEFPASLVCESDATCPGYTLARQVPKPEKYHMPVGKEPLGPVVIFRSEHSDCVAQLIAAYTHVNPAYEVYAEAYMQKVAENRKKEKAAKDEKIAKDGRTLGDEDSWWLGHD